MVSADDRGAHRDTDTNTTVQVPEPIGMLWAGLLLAPLAFMLAMIANYALSGAPCPVRHELLLHGIHFTSVLIGACGVLIAWSMQRSTGRGSGAAAIGSGVRTLSRVSVGSSALFVAAMLVQWAVDFAYLPCR
jgi:hypothetical protein